MKLSKIINTLFPTKEKGVLLFKTDIEERIGYVFNDKSLLNKALSHLSYALSLSENPLESNERFEFLGDAILGFLAADHLHNRYPKKLEGELSRIKSVIISRKALKAAADSISLSESILLSKSEEKTGGRTRFSINSNAFEAIIAAIYLDGGLEPAKTFVHKFVLSRLEEFMQDDDMVNYKSLLLEKVQAKGDGTVTYVVSKETGPDHNKSFEIAAIRNGVVCGTGVGKSKKEAEQLAAKDALQKMVL